MPPFMGGGEMIETVGLSESTYAPPPSRFEPGTPGIAEGIGFGSAVEYLDRIGMDKIHSYEKEIGGHLYQEVASCLCQKNLAMLFTSAKYQDGFSSLRVCWELNRWNWLKECTLI